MATKKEIETNVWEIFRKIYDIKPNVVQSDKQVALVNSIVEYVETITAKPVIKEKKHVGKNKSICTG